MTWIATTYKWLVSGSQKKECKWHAFIQIKREDTLGRYVVQHFDF